MEQTRRLGLNAPLPEPENEALLDVLSGSHCGLMPAAAFGPMAKAQNFRDAWMARQVHAAVSEHGGAALITGNGHVHKYRGVPYYLRRQTSDLDAGAIVTIMLVETSNLDKPPTGSVPTGAGSNRLSWAADWVISTRPAEREDPCVAMRKRFGKTADK